MTRLHRRHVEDAREQAGVPEDVLCFGLTGAVPVLRELKPILVEVGKSAIPGVFRWLLGGLVDTIVEGLIDGLDEWRQDTCNEDGEA